MTEPARDPGTIITFYSYKGGTGRSMALANVAWILASNGYRVLTVDWDLEAPGLHRYFAPFMLDPNLADSEGVIDIVNDYVTAAMTPQPEPEPALAESVAPEPVKWYEPFANVRRYATSLDWTFPEVEGRKGWIDLIAAGRQGQAYATRMNSFSWQNFYDKLGGGGFIEAMKERMKADYDYVLIDSRTGVSDTSGICTVQLPDVLVVCFTLNRQSIEGASAVAASVEAQRPAGSSSAFRIFPVPTRVEKAEKQKLDLAREAARDAFSPFLGHVNESDREKYWGDVEIFYEPFYAYEEILATFGDKPLQTSSLLASMERLTSRLTDGKVAQLGPLDETERQRVMARYARQSVRKTAKAAHAAEEYLYYISYARSDLDETLERFVEELGKEVALLSGRKSAGFVDFHMFEGTEWEQSIGDALQRSRLLVPLISPALFASKRAGKEFQYFTDHGQILPVVWEPPTDEVPKAAAAIAWTGSEDFGAYAKLGLHALMRLRRYEPQYHEFLKSFARKIVEASGQATATDRPPWSEEIPNAFAAAPEPVAATEEAPPVTAEAGPFSAFAAAIPRLDRQEILDKSEELLGSLDTVPVTTVTRILLSLGRRQFFDIIERVADALIVRGVEGPAVSIWYARALVEQDKLTAALAVLKEAVSSGWKSASLNSLLGRVYARLYIRAGMPALPRNQQNLALAIRAYREAYEVDHAVWNGINVVALMMRAANDQIPLPNISPEAARELAGTLLESIEQRVGRGDAAVTDYAVAAEACLALERFDEMLQWVASFMLEPEVDAYAVTALLRQFTDVWRLGVTHDIGERVLPMLQAELLRREGGSVAVSADQVPVLAPAVELEKVFGSDSSRTLGWYRTGLERARAVARIEDREGKPLGTGFLIRGGDLRPSMSDPILLLTSNHIFESGRKPGGIPADTRIFFDASTRPSSIVGVPFSSRELDVVLLRLDTVPGPSLPVAPESPGTRGRVYLISHASDGDLSVSLADGELLDHDDTRIHYRAPTKPGNSGSPLFNEHWELIGVHHAADREMPRLHGLEGTYEANEAISIHAIQRLMRSSAP